MKEEFEWNNELVEECSEYVFYNLHRAEPLKKQINKLVNDFIESKTPKLLYATNDGHKVYSQDTYPIYFISYDFKIGEKPANTCLSENNPDYKYFKLKMNAIHYKELNQPRLSVADVNYYINEFGIEHSTYKLIEFANNRNKNE